jgi:hypothetical protein
MELQLPKVVGALVAIETTTTLALVFQSP